MSNIEDWLEVDDKTEVKIEDVSMINDVFEEAALLSEPVPCDPELASQMGGEIADQQTIDAHS